MNHLIKEVNNLEKCMFNITKIQLFFLNIQSLLTYKYNMQIFKSSTYNFIQNSMGILMLARNKFFLKKMEARE